MQHTYKFLFFLLTVFISAPAYSQVPPNDSCGTTIKLDGNDDYLNLGNLNYISSGNAGEYTVSLWLKLRSYNTDHSFLFGDEKSANNGVLLEVNPSGFVNTYHTSTGRVVSNYKVITNQWTHLAIVQTTTNLTLYANGVLVDTLLNTPNLHIETTDETTMGVFKVGASLDRVVDGQYDEVSVWNRALNAVEISSIMANELAGTETNLVAYYNFNQGAGNAVAADITGNGNTATLTNMNIYNSWVRPNGTAGGNMIIPTPTNVTIAPGDSLLINNVYQKNPGTYVDSLQSLAGCDSIVTVNLSLQGVPPNDSCGTVVNFDGVNDYVSFSKSHYLASTYTIETWFKTSGAATKSILGAVKKGTTDHHVLLEVVPGGQLRFVHRSPAGTAGGTDVYSATAVNDGNWHHVAAVKTTTGLLLYIDGSLSASAPDATAINDSVTAVIGKRFPVASSFHFLGAMDEIKIWGAVRNQSEIVAGMASALNGTETDLHTYFNLNEQYGGIANDISVNLNHGTLRGMTVNSWAKSNGNAPCLTIAVPNNACGTVLDFNGVNNYIQLSDTLPVGSTSNTLELWVKVPVVGTGNLTLGERVGIILGNYNGAPNANWEIHTNGQLRIYWNNGQVDVLGVTDLRDNKWHHIAFVRNTTNNTFKAYVDGMLDIDHNNAGAAISFTSLHRIGRDNRAATIPYFHGKIDEMRIWNTAKTMQQIIAELNNTLTGSEPNLVSYWDFNEGSASPMINDKTVTGNAGTLVNIDLNMNWMRPDGSVGGNKYAAVNASICQGDSLFLEGAYRSVAGVYTDTLSSAGGCDSVVVTTLVLDSLYTTVNAPVSICSGDSALIFGNYQMAAGLYYDSLQTVTTGCDSIIVQQLIVNPVYTVNDSVSICTGDSLFLAGSYQTISGTYVDTLSSVFGCDSIIHTALAVVNQLTANAFVSICTGDSILLGGAYQTSPGSYVDTVASVFGCDSITTTILTVLDPVAAADTVAICAGDSLMLGGSYQTMPGVYVDTLTTVIGCDSIVSTTLMVMNPYLINDSVDICTGDSILLGGAYQTASGTYTDSLVSVYGCDSIIHTTLAVVNQLTTNVSAFICAGDSIMLGGAYQMLAGIYVDTVPSAFGCDSIITTTLSVNTINTNVTKAGNMLTVGEPGAVYQWVDCNNNYAIIASDTLQSFTAVSNGSYAVVITANGCTDTSACTVVNDVSILESTFNSAISVYPNPTKGNLVINLGAEYTNVTIELYDVKGSLLKSNKVSNAKTINFEINTTPGIYIMAITTNEHRAVVKLVKE